MIQQQCYTRAARGLFRPSAGYDTVAKSAGLTEEFIKERLHPFCYYNALTTGECPKVLTVIQFPEGLTMIGRTVHVERDFTGERATFFTHNYVMPRQLGVFDAEFLSETEDAELPELDELPLTEGQGKALPFETERLQQLAGAVTDAVAGTRKVYVVIPEGDYLTESVIEWLYRNLPTETAEELGFTTYSREPLNKKFLHLIFVERDSMTYKDKVVERDYFVDLENGYFKLPKVESGTVVKRGSEKKKGFFEKIFRFFKG